MRTKHLFFGLLVAGAASLSLIAWRQATAAREVGAKTSALAESETAARASLQQAQDRLAAAEREKRTHQAEIDRLRNTASIRKDAPPKSPPRASLSILEMIRDDPEAEALYLESQRAQLSSMYGPLIRSLDLSTEGAAKFQAHQLQRRETMMDLNDALRTQGAASATAVAQLRADAEKRYADAQRELLGDEGYRAMQDYERTASFREVVGMVAGMAAIEHVPLSPEQADALVRAAADASSNYRAGGSLVIVALDWAAVETRAREILSPAQFDIFQNMDPGPTRGGIQQSRLYSSVDLAKRSETQAPANSTARNPRN